MRKLYSFIFTGILLVVFSCNTEESSSHELSNNLWPKVKSVHKPGTYWWWMGSAVDKENLTNNLESLEEVGIGSVHVIPIYGVKGEEHRNIDFLSTKWMDMLSYTVEEATRLNMNVDMSTTTGWPFGGTHVTKEYAASKFEFKKITVTGNKNLKKQVNRLGLEEVMAYSTDKKIISLTDKVEDKGLLNWNVPSGNWDIYFTYKKGTEQMVKRAAPGNIGLVLDPFSPKGLDYYLKRYDKAFAQNKNINLRAQYHDSYEYYHATWTSNFFDRFKEKNNYDLRNFFPELLDSTRINPFIKADYRRTLADFHLNYIEKWTDWSHQNGWITRNQAHGAPGNLLDLYAASDIPETETFGSRKFKIPGIRYVVENNSKSAPPNPLILKFASSAAHVTGKLLTSSETGTWLRDHFKSSLSQIKPEIDELFFSGINHVFYHGNAYSPKDADWPGWIFYASTHFENKNAFWHDFSELNSYISRCQSILQSGKPANDILLYWPVEDIYHAYPDLLIKMMNVHKIEWFEDSAFGKLATHLSDKGYSFDYISDKQLLDVTADKNHLDSHGSKYKTILIPNTKHIPLKTWNQLKLLAKSGATIIFQENLPEDVPGFDDLVRRRSELIQSRSELKFTSKDDENFQISKLNKGNFIVSNDIDSALNSIGVQEEKIVHQGINYIKRTHEKGYYYFFTNLSDKKLDTWIPLNSKFKSAAILDPRVQNKTGMAAIRQKNNTTEVYLQIEPGESYFLKTFTNQEVDGNKWAYSNPTSDPIEIKGTWQVDFIQGAPNLPQSFTTENLDSWVNQKDTTAQSFAGTAKYTLKFNAPNVESDGWLLDLGKVCESARVQLNGNEIGTLWSFPFHIDLGDHLKKGENILSLEVTNLSANRLRDMDKRNVEWEKYFFVNIFYKKFDASQWPLMDSGLIGPVTLTPLNKFLETK